MSSTDASTSDSRRDVPAERSDGNGGRRGRAIEIKTKRDMVTKALIVSERWGPSIHGGITDGLHLAIRLLQNMGISVHCTALQATKEEEREAEELGVTLELPTKEGLLEFREPHRDWLTCPDEYFPKLGNLTNVKFVFGFSAFTSIPAFKILKKVCPTASCYLINLFEKDDITPLIVGCSKEELEFRKRILSTEFKNAKCSFSVGETIFTGYRRLYHKTNQQLLSPMINEEYLVPPISDKLPTLDLEHERFKIISVVQEYEFEDPKKLEAVITAVNEVVEYISELQKTPPVWKIVGIPLSKEKEIVKKLQRNSKLKITPTYVISAEELNRELLSSHLVLIPPSTTNYSNLTLAAMCAAIPVVYPRRSQSDVIVNKHFDIIEAKEYAIDMDGDHKDLRKRILSVMLNNEVALQRAKIVREHIKAKVAEDLRDSNVNFIASITADMQCSSAKELECAVEDTDGPEQPRKRQFAGKAGNEENIVAVCYDQDKTEPKRHVTERQHIKFPSVNKDQKIKMSSKYSTARDISYFTVFSVFVAIISLILSSIIGFVQRILFALFLAAFTIFSNYYFCRGIDDKTSQIGEPSRDSDWTKGIELVEDDVSTAAELEHIIHSLLSTRSSSEEERVHLRSGGMLTIRPKGQQGQIEIKVRVDGIIPKGDRKVRDVDAAFYANKRTKYNAVLVGKQLDQRHYDMRLHQIGEGCISYIMDCQSLEALESLMDDYSSRSLHRMVKSTFLSESLLDEIGALYISLGTSINYEEYLLCLEELADVKGEDIHQLRIEAIEEINDKIESQILEKKAALTEEKVKTRLKARDRDILKGVSVEQEIRGQSELDGLMDEWIQIKKELQELNNTHSELVFDRQEFVQKTGAIIDEVDIPLEIKQELMMAFLKSLPLGPDKTGKPGQQLVIEGDVLMEYVKNIVHDFEFPTKGKQDIIEQFSKLVRTKLRKTNVKARLTAKQESLQERIQAIVDDADIPDEQKKVYQQLRQVERGTPLSNTVRVLLSKYGKKSSGQVFEPRGLTINQNGHVLVCDIGHGSVKTVTADTAQILTSVTVHGLPHNFKPTDIKMADNGDYYTVDVGNKYIVVSDAKSEVKQIIAMGKLKGPTGVFVDKDRNVFIADYGADCVIKCNGDGDIISRRQLSGPWSLTMNSKYQLIVSCQRENCIYVLDSNLEILYQFGSDHLVYPWGVTVDNADNIYVVDSLKKIVKFDRQGEYLETITVGVNPVYIAVFTDGRIVCSDISDFTVKVIYK